MNRAQVLALIGGCLVLIVTLAGIPSGAAFPSLPYLLVLGLIFLSLTWLYFDAKTRKKSAGVVLLLGLLTWPFGLVFWLVMRPQLEPRQRLRRRRRSSQASLAGN